MKNKYNIVFDVGKENAKILLFNKKLKIIKILKIKYPLLELRKNFYFKDINFLIFWFKKKLHSINKDYKIDSIITATHGAAFGLVGENNKSLFGIMDYENDYSSINNQFNDVLPKYKYTFSPNSEKGLSIGKQLLYLKLKEKKIFNKVENILTLPQYISWVFSKKLSSEISYLGNHTHLWNFRTNKFSSLIKKLKIENKFPKIKKAGSLLGHYILDERLIKQKIKIYNGLHDSDAAYSLFLKSSIKRFSLVSSGTHFVIMNSHTSTKSLVENYDMYAGLDIFGKKVPTIRFMGGREFEFLNKELKLTKSRKYFDESFFDKQDFLYPSYGVGGPFNNLKGNLESFKLKRNAEKYMAAVSYIAFMTNYCLNLLKSKEDVIITGPLINNKDVLKILNSLTNKKKIYLYPSQEATSIGCNMIKNKNYNLKLKIFKNKKYKNTKYAYNFWLKKIKDITD